MTRLNKNLPHEIVLEILKRLPVKPLMRFKCVSKSWQCMIDDPDFVAVHLKHSALSGTNWKYKEVKSSPPDFVDTRMVLGFGYSDIINDYRIVRITYFHDNNEGYMGRLEYEVQVYRLSTDMWRTVEFNNGCELSDLSTVSFNGNLHWISIVADGDRCWCYGSIITFGVAAEVFNQIALPKSCLVGVTYDYVYLSVLNNSLVLLINHVDPRNQLNDTCYVWVMTEYGVAESWTKLHTLDLNEGVSRFHGFTWSGELLMDTYQCELISWNPSMGLTRLLSTLGPLDLVTVVESLVSPLGQN
ncbi:F-box/kelch-repeat protein At3g06240-like [Syzygium oleosum]|uniref:F-box/kelch-repeat protein At3g06240-like n=1 Tax=Syzygium oleosum TaxID=219896 RepID=UPI0011D27178|nr:F-box/kelch-repeat protein At3g06240-like [Syzygium oleosum]